MANTTVTISVTVSTSMLVKIIQGQVKGITLAGAIQAAQQPESKPKVYDESTCVTVQGNDALDKSLDALRGPGMIKRVQETYQCDYGVASTLVSAHAASKKAKRDTLLIVPAKAQAIRAIVDGLTPKPTLVKASK